MLTSEVFDLRTNITGTKMSEIILNRHLIHWLNTSSQMFPFFSNSSLSPNLCHFFYFCFNSCHCFPLVSCVSMCMYMYVCAQVHVRVCVYVCRRKHMSQWGFGGQKIIWGVYSLFLPEIQWINIGKNLVRPQRQAFCTSNIHLCQLSLIYLV